MKRLRAILEYLLGFLIIGLLLISIAAIVTVKVFGDELEAYVTGLVNERINTRVTVRGIHVGIFHNFPNTSILLEDLTCWSSPNFNTEPFSADGGDTLLSAEKVGVSFNLWKLIRKKYDITRIEISRGTMNLLTDQDGEINFKLRKEESPPGKKGRILLDVGQLRIEEFEFRLINRTKQLDATGYLDQLVLNGRSSKGETSLKGSLKGSVETFSNRGMRFISDRKIEADLNIMIQDSFYVLKNAQMQIGRITADIQGFIRVPKGKGLDLDLEARTKALEIHEITDLLPADENLFIRKIRGNGKMQLSAKIKGLANSTSTPLISARFLTSNASLAFRDVPFALRNLDLKGSYSNGGGLSPVTNTLDIESMSTSIGLTRLSAKGEIKNFMNPEFSLDLQGEVHPEQWLDWYPSLPVHSMEGLIIPDLRISGSFDRNPGKGKKLLALEVAGRISLEDLMVRIREDLLPLEEMNGSLYIENNFWEPVLSGKFGSTDFHLSGTGLNLISCLLQREEKLIASATFSSDHFDLQEILEQFPETGHRSRPLVNFPERMDLKLGFSINDFSKDLLKASNVKGIAFYDSPFLYVDSLVMETMGGTLKGSIGMAQDKYDSIFTSVEAVMSDLDISQLFRAFNNFGQKQLGHEQIKGTLTGSSVFSATFDPSFRIRPSSILSENNLNIKNGELKQFKPIMALSRFIEVEELNHVIFSTLENNILIRDSQVIIPNMAIRSNAMNLSASGTHSFDNTYEYRLQLKLSELLYSKARRASKFNEFETAFDESDQRTIYLKIADAGSGPKVELDRKETSKKIRANLKDEKTELKKVLNRELGLYKKDEEVKKQIRPGTREQKEEIFQLEFAGERDSTTLQPGKKNRKDGWRTKKDTAENKPAAGFVLDE